MAFRRHQKSHLLGLIIQALYDDGWNVIYLNDPEFHPFVLRIYKGSLKFDLRIYVWNLTHGGGAARAADEYRIQITGVDQFESQQRGQTVILGWWEEGGVFAGFDFNFHSETLGSSPSIQIKEEALRSAYVNGFATWEKDNNEIAIAFRPDFLGEYIKNLGGLHSFGQSDNDLEVLDETFQSPQSLNDEMLETVTMERRVVISQITRKLRDVSFKSRVLTAYNFTCSFCGVQLKLIDAAHILPVENNGTDETWNGVALCALHHRAYDRNLVTFNGAYQIVLNNAALDELATRNLAGGRQQFQNNLRAILHLPPAVSDRPHVDTVTQANSIRGWNLPS